MKDEIGRRFALNLGRVRSLLDAYQAALPGTSGRPSVATTDVLRASVVFLHASLEDLLRSVLAWKLPEASPEHLDDVALVGERPRKFTLADVAKHRGLTVDELIARSVAASLDRSNFNDVDEIAKALERCGLAASLVGPFGSDLAVMMARRHWIVHRADRNQASGAGQFVARSLHPAEVGRWLAAVEAFGTAVLGAL